MKKKIDTGKFFQKKNRKATEKCEVKDPFQDKNHSEK
jgi:hypothetical protein